MAAPRVTAYLFVLAVGLAAGWISGIIGTGAAAILLPVLVIAFGPKQAVPIMAVASIMANAARVMVWWREVDWKAFAVYSATGVPAAALGARTLLTLPAWTIEVALGVFFLAMIPCRRRLAHLNLRFGLPHLAAAGASIGFVTGIVLSTGPLSVPAFQSYGLVKGAFLATEAASSLGLYVSKVATFRELGAMPLGTALEGVIVGASLMAGTFAGKAVVLRLSAETFRHLLDGVMLVSGLSLIWSGLH